MKRYLVFFGSTYYPNKGMDDFIGDFDTNEEAVEAIKKASEEEDKEFDYSWGLVYDSSNRNYSYKAGC